MSEKLSSVFFLYSCSVSCQQHLCACTWRLKFLLRGLSNLLNKPQLGPSPSHSSIPAALCFFLTALALRSFPFHVHLTLSGSKLHTLISIYFLKMLVEKRRCWRLLLQRWGKETKLILHRTSVTQQSYFLIWKIWIPWSPRKQEVLSRVSKMQ